MAIVVMFRKEKNGNYWTKWKVYSDEKMVYEILDVYMDNFGLTEVYDLAIMSEETFEKLGVI